MLTIQTQRAPKYRTQTHESPLIQQNQPKSNTKSIQGTQTHKLRNIKRISSRTQTHLNISTISSRTQTHLRKRSYRLSL